MRDNGKCNKHHGTLPQVKRYSDLKNVKSYSPKAEPEKVYITTLNKTAFLLIVIYLRNNSVEYEVIYSKTAKTLPSSYL